MDFSRIFGSLECEYTDYNLCVMYHSIAEIMAPIHAICSRISGAEWQLRKISNDEVVYDNKYVNKLLSTPNPLQNWQQLIYELSVYEIVTGKNFLYANAPDTLSFNYKNISALWNLWPYAIQIITDVQIKLLSATSINDLIKKYRLNDGTEIDPSVIMFTQHGSLLWEDRKINGRSPLLSAKKAIANLIAVYEARGAIYMKRGALGFIVSKKSDGSGLVPLNPKEKAELMDEYNKSYGLTGHKSPVAMTSLPVDFIKVAMSIQELQPFDETKADALAIYGALNVPTDLMPKTEGATFENQKMAEKSLYQNVSIPRAMSLAQSLTSFLKLDEAGYYLHPSFEHIQTLQEDKKQKADVDWRNNETMRVRFIHGIVTLNDWITSIGMEEVKNAIYTKRIFEMDESELSLVKQILSIKSNSSGSASSGGLQNDQNVSNN